MVFVCVVENHRARRGEGERKIQKRPARAGAERMPEKPDRTRANALTNSIVEIKTGQGSPATLETKKRTFADISNPEAADKLPIRKTEIFPFDFLSFTHLV